MDQIFGTIHNLSLHLQGTEKFGVYFRRSTPLLEIGFPQHFQGFQKCTKNTLHYTFQLCLLICARIGGLSNSRLSGGVRQSRIWDFGVFPAIWNWDFTDSKLGFWKHPMKMGFCKAIHEIGIWQIYIFYSWFLLSGLVGFMGNGDL